MKNLVRHADNAWDEVTLAGLRQIFGFRKMSEADFLREQEQILRQVPLPELWLFGKTGSGKTSIVKFLTGAEHAEIGSGFQPQTRRSQRYDFPSSDAPLLRFLDTRGLGETRYDPKDDIEAFHDSTHLQIVTVKVLDHALAEIVEPLRKIRAAKPQRPALLALTCLHEAYPGQQHPTSDPFVNDKMPDSLPEELRRSIEQHERQFAGLVDRIVPLDLTRIENGFDEPHFGGDRLKSAMVELLPATYRQTLLSLSESMRSLRDLNERRAMPYVLSYSSMAATAGAVPLPWIDIPLVMAIQSHLVTKLATLYGQPVTAGSLASLSGIMGGRVASRLLLRSSWKLVPYVGIAANAALAYAYTFGLGKACCWYFGQIRQGNAPSEQELRQVWKQQMLQAALLWQGRGSVKDTK